MMARTGAAETGRTELERLTADAARAAEQGQWDRVDECYHEREAAMSGVVLSREEIERLLAVDRRIQAQAFVARTALAEQLRQSFATRLRLKGLRSGIGETALNTGTVWLKA